MPAILHIHLYIGVASESGVDFLQSILHHLNASVIVNYEFEQLSDFHEV